MEKSQSVLSDCFQTIEAIIKHPDRRFNLDFQPYPDENRRDFKDILFYKKLKISKTVNKKINLAKYPIQFNSSLMIFGTIFAISMKLEGFPLLKIIRVSNIQFAEGKVEKKMYLEPWTEHKIYLFGGLTIMAITVFGLPKLLLYLNKRGIRTYFSHPKTPTPHQRRLEMKSTRSKRRRAKSKI